MEVKLETNSLRKVSLLLNNMTYILNTHRFRGFKVMFADWLKFSLIEELTYEIDVWFQEKILTNDALDLVGSPTFLDVVAGLGHCFKAVRYTSIITYS
jgi:hypothetical protein